MNETTMESVQLQAQNLLAIHLNAEVVIVRKSGLELVDEVERGRTRRHSVLTRRLAR